ncbi:MAG: hypothetical protein IVW52_05235 [Acidimicrobiales bacterium]|nr:hypothetical protein [Acidimicrobiales bacterium]
MNFAGQVYASLAPSQSQYLAARVSAFRAAPSAQSGAVAVLNTLGARFTPGHVALQAFPRGVEFS